MLEKVVTGIDSDGNRAEVRVVFEMDDFGRFFIVSGTLAGVSLQPIENGMMLWNSATRKQYRFPEFEKLLLTRLRRGSPDGGAAGKKS